MLFIYNQTNKAPAETFCWNIHDNHKKNIINHNLPLMKKTERKDRDPKKEILKISKIPKFLSGIIYSNRSVQ